MQTGRGLRPVESTGQQAITRRRGGLGVGRPAGHRVDRSERRRVRPALLVTQRVGEPLLQEFVLVEDDVVLLPK